VRDTRAIPRPPAPQAGLTRIAWRAKQLRQSESGPASGQTAKFRGRAQRQLSHQRGSCRRRR